MINYSQGPLISAITSLSFRKNKFSKTIVVTHSVFCRESLLRKTGTMPLLSSFSTIPTHLSIWVWAIYILPAESEQKMVSTFVDIPLRI